MDIDPPIAGYYGQGKEQQRLFDGSIGTLERLRTWNVLERILPSSGTVLDIGGGAGVHAEWLARRGFEVELFDPIPLHVTQAQKLAESLPSGQRFSAEEGDARNVLRPDGCADVVLMLGPLYHLVDVADRMAALAEARRLLRSGGVLVAAGISRFVWAMDAYRQQLVSDPATYEWIMDSVETGRSVAEPEPTSFLGYFHRPDELRDEIVEAGFSDTAVRGVEGFAWLLADLPDILVDATQRDQLLSVLQQIEREPTIVGASAHLIASARAAE